MNRGMGFPWWINADRPADAILHRAPQMPIRVDHTEAAPEAVQEFLDRPLYTVVDDAARNGEMLHMFTSRQGAVRYRGQLIADQDPFWVPRSTFGTTNDEESDTQISNEFAHMVTPNGPVSMAPLVSGVTDITVPGSGFVDLWESPNLDGCCWRVLDDHIVFNFKGLRACGFLFWGWEYANDNVTSLDWKTVWTDLILCEHAYLGGSWLFLPGRGPHQLPHLGVYGWNNRASSMLFMNSP
jgi:hypothetical protein